RNPRLRRRTGPGRSCSSQSVFPLSGAASYTIGQDPSGAVVADFDAPRPQWIERANILMPGIPVVPHPLAIVDALGWAAAARGDATHPTVPDILYNDRAYPLSTLFLSGAPAAGYQLELFTWLQVQTFLTAGDAVIL